MSSNQPTNVDVAAALQVSAAAVSRYREGSRTPRMPVQVRIADAYRWPIEQQARAQAAGTWAESFEEVLQAQHAPHPE